MDYILYNCRFVKSTALEIDLPDEFSEAGRYQARFIGTDIGTELDILEDKHASIISMLNYEIFCYIFNNIFIII